ncbi:MAG TPA: class A beta-lactamase [Luteibacter sp.]|jgi:beta-lactamase class A|nr:class A beta-lactamase [Luteibacter sp.]
MTRFGFMLLIALAAAIGAPPEASAAENGATPNTRSELQVRLQALADRARPGTLGVVVLDLTSGTEWRVNADRAYPMMSVFKAPIAATVLAQVDKGVVSLDQVVTLTRADVRDGSAMPSIGVHFHGDSMTFTVRQLLVAAVSQSDNTAADALIRLVGGPEAVTAFLRSHGIEGMRVDLDEGGVSLVFAHAGPSGLLPPAETKEQQDQRMQRGLEAFLADPRNRSTPDAAIAFLRKLWANDLVSSASTHYLIDLLYAQTVPSRLRAGVPSSIRLADKCGTSETLDGVTAAYNDIGVMTWPNGHSVVVAAFLTASTASKSERDAIFADLARAVVSLDAPANH